MIVNFRHWRGSGNPCGTWYWFTDVDAEFSAGIVDDSQTFGRPVRTHYRVFAVHRDEIFQAENVYWLDFEAAKHAALCFTALIAHKAKCSGLK